MTNLPRSQEAGFNASQGGLFQPVNGVLLDSGEFLSRTQSLAEHEPAALSLLERVCLFRLGIDAATLTSIFTGKKKVTIKLAGPALAAVEEARLSVFRYIETFYNPVRLHQSLNYLSPGQYEQQQNDRRGT